VWGVGGGVPLPTGGSVWERGSAPYPENFLRFGGKSGVFLWTLGAKFRFFCDQNSKGSLVNIIYLNYFIFFLVIFLLNLLNCSIVLG